MRKDFIEANHGANVAGRQFLDFLLAEPIVFQDLHNRVVDAPAVFLFDQCDSLALADLSAVDLPDSDAAHVIAVLERNHLHLKWPFRVGFRRRDVSEDRVEQRLQVLRGDSQVRGGHA